MPVNGLYINPTTFVPITQVHAGIRSEFATRERTWELSTMFGYLPNPDPILKKLGQDISIYRELLSDAQVNATVESRTSGVRSLSWEIDRGKAKSREAKFIENIFENLKLDQILTDIIDGALYGYKPIEINWRSVDNKWIPMAVVGKPSRWFRFGDNNELLFITREAPQGIPVPQRKFLLARRHPEYDNPYGDAVLSKCFWPVTFKKGGLKFWVRFTEKYGMPWMLGKYPEGTSNAVKKEMLDGLESLVQDAIGIIPENSTLEMLEHKGTASAQLYKMLLDFCNAEISKAVLSQTLTTEIGSTGSYAAAQEHGEIRQDVVDGDRRMAEEVLNELISWIVELNFGERHDRPTFTMYQEEDVDQALAERDKKLSDTGQVKFTKKYFRQNYGFEEDEIEVVEPAKPSEKPPAQFAEQTTGQERLDTLLDSLDPKMLQEQAKKLLQPAIDLINKAGSYAEIENGLPDLYPNLDDTGIQKLLERAMLLAAVQGQAETRENA